jgi:hypothetical protein
MFVELNDRVFLNTEKLTRIKIDEVQDGMRIRFYEGNVQVAKSKRFKSEKDAKQWLKDNFLG